MNKLSFQLKTLYRPSDERKSGIVDSVETHAPPKKTIWLLSLIISVKFSILLSIKKPAYSHYFIMA